VFMPDPPPILASKLKPNSDGHLFLSPIRINSLGFRGKEFSKNKGNAYRIVALGESTTFGCTLRPQDRPWPEVLEQMIQERIKPARPVEVINAGTPGYTLQKNLLRLPMDILPLKADMIISYHGWNWFGAIFDGMPPVVGKTPPRFYERPIMLLADCEYALKLSNYRRHYAAQPAIRTVSMEDAMNSRYAQGYRDLIELARTNHIRLALANFCLAVNAQTKPEVTKFYDMTCPIYPGIKANIAHTMMLEQLSREHPDVCCIDTHRNLDGEHEKFIDHVHLTQEGRQQLAENIYAGIEQTLRGELNRPASAPLGTATK
jgi:lysophospholipase L1-like esterase